MQRPEQLLLTVQVQRGIAEELAHTISEFEHATRHAAGYRAGAQGVGEDRVVHALVHGNPAARISSAMSPPADSAAHRSVRRPSGAAAITRRCARY